ncbi:MAG: ATP-binding protein [Candidatus Enteromonas sp.]|nr:ATP-binding protein [Candidatus Enteromonas sp.]
MKLIERIDYLSELKSLVGTPDIKVITGVRRAGKSKLMDAFARSLEEGNEKTNVVRINLRLKKFEALLNGDNLYRYANSHIAPEIKNFLIIDEIQDCTGFERVINSLFDEGIYEIYLTGSNAFLLSSDLATLFGGRTFDVHVFPFSFKEYLSYFPSEDIQTSFDAYVRRGGLSGSYLYADGGAAKRYLEGVVRTTIVKDVVKKFRIENEPLLNLIIDFLADNIGSKTSIRNIANTLTSNRMETNNKTVGSYIDYLCRSYLFYPCTRFDVKGKRYLESDKKYYLCDLGFRFALLGNRRMDYGHLYENLVFLELRRRGYEVYVGVLYDKEIDFVAIKDGEKLYIQVSDDITVPETFQREVRPLLSIRDAYPKILLARTKHPEEQYEGIRIFDMADWLGR